MNRLWRKVDQSGGPESCWLWTAGRDKDGYGKLRWEGKHCRAHRVALFLVTGTWGTQACHRCNVTSCCNPSHLYWGDNSTNMQDRAKVWCPSPTAAKLTVADVDVIRARRAAGEKLRVLAAEFEVCESTISMAARGVTWS